MHLRTQVCHKKPVSFNKNYCIIIFALFYVGRVVKKCHLLYFHSVSFLAERWWIGAALDTVKNVWIWDYSGTAMSFTNWHPVEPNGEGREQCALMWDADLWQDYPCTDLFYIICERN